MSSWTKVSGYMIVLPEIPVNSFGKHAGDGSWIGRTDEDPYRWIAAVLPDSRDSNMWEYPHICLPRPPMLYVTWTNDDSEEEAEELITCPTPDLIKLAFPTGSEGPLNLTISSVLSRHYGHTLHVVFNGNLRGVHDIAKVVDWWSTIQKYLSLTQGHIRIESYKDTYIHTIGEEPNCYANVYDEKPKA